MTLTYTQVTTLLGGMVALSVCAADAWFFGHALGGDTDKALLWAGFGALVGGSDPRTLLSFGKPPAP